MPLISTRELVTPSYRPEGDALSGIERYLAVEEIRTTKSRYCVSVDERDWAKLRTVFAKDCVIDWPLPGYDIQTADAFVDFLASAIDASIEMRHNAYNLQVEFVSADEALVRWDHENTTWIVDDSRPNVHQWGQYREKYRRVGSQWLISYFSEQYLYNMRLSANRREAGIGDGGAD